MATWNRKTAQIPIILLGPSLIEMHKAETHYVNEKEMGVYAYN